MLGFLAQAGIPLPYTTHEVIAVAPRSQDRERRIDNQALLQDRPALADTLAEHMVHRDRENRRLADQTERRAAARESTRAQEVGALIRAFFHL